MYKINENYQKLPGSYLFTNLKNVANDGTFPMFRGILNSLIVSGGIYRGQSGQRDYPSWNRRCHPASGPCNYSGHA